MKRYSRNILVFAENNGNQSGFNVYIDFSGQQEYLITHRHNNVMYGILKDGVRLADLHRGLQEKNLPTLYRRKIGYTATKQLQNSMRHLLVVIDEYIKDREQYS